MARLTTILGFVLCGISASAVAEDNHTLASAQFQWKEARIRFRRAGDLIGEGQLQAAKRELATAETALALPYRQLAESYQSKLKLLHANRSGNNGYHAYGIAGQLCYELGAYDAAIKWMQRAEAVRAGNGHSYTARLTWCLCEVGREEEVFADNPVAAEQAADLLTVRTTEFANASRLANQLASMPVDTTGVSRLAFELATHMEMARLYAEESTDIDAVVRAIRNRYHIADHETEPHDCLAALEATTAFAATATTDTQLATLYELAIDCFSKLHDTQAKRAWQEHLLVQTAGNNAIAANVFLGRAKQAYNENRLDEALRLYQFVRDTYPDFEPELRSLVDFPFFSPEHAIAQILQKQQKYNEAIAAYEVVIAADSKKSRHSGWCHSAAQQIAACFQSLENYEQALEYFLLARDKYPFRSGCGTCNGTARDALAWRIETCLLQLGRHAEAANSCLENLQRASLDSRRASRLIQLYKSAGQMNDLNRLLDDSDAKQLETWEKHHRQGQTPALRDSSTASWPVRELLPIYELAWREDLAGLMAVVRQASNRPLDSIFDRWNGLAVVKMKVAADALAAGGDKAFKTMTVYDTDSDSYSPLLLYAIARTQCQEAVPWLTAYVRAHEDSSRLSRITHTLAQSGDAGVEALRLVEGELAGMNQFANRDELRRIAAQPDGRLRLGAWNALKRFSPEPLPTRWPIPNVGSLPKQLPEVSEQRDE